MLDWKETMEQIRGIEPPENLDGCYTNLTKLRRLMMTKPTGVDAKYCHDCAVEVLGWMRRNKEAIKEDKSYDIRSFSSALWDLIGILDDTNWFNW